MYLIFRKKHWQKRKKSGGSKETMSGSTNLFLVAEFQVTDTSEHQTIYEFFPQQAFQVEIIKIIRGDKLINMPKSDEMVLSGDIHMMEPMMKSKHA